MQASPEGLCVQRATCATLAALAADNVVRNASTAAELGGVKEVCYALALFGEDAGVGRESLLALHAMCGGSGADGIKQR